MVVGAAGENGIRNATLLSHPDRYLVISNPSLSLLACHILADFYMTVENDIAKAMELYENNCKELNVYDSCLALGNIFLTDKSKEPVRVT